MTDQELEQRLRAWYAREVADTEAAPADLRETLARDFRISTPAVVRTERSADGTTKFLLRLADGKLIESVFIPDNPSGSEPGEDG